MNIRLRIPFTALQIKMRYLDIKLYTLLKNCAIVHFPFCRCDKGLDLMSGMRGNGLLMGFVNVEEVEGEEEWKRKLHRTLISAAITDCNERTCPRRALLASSTPWERCIGWVLVRLDSYLGPKIYTKIYIVFNYERFYSWMLWSYGFWSDFVVKSCENSCSINLYFLLRNLHLGTW